MLMWFLSPHRGGVDSSGSSYKIKHSSSTTPRYYPRDNSVGIPPCRCKNLILPKWFNHQQNVTKQNIYFSFTVLFFEVLATWGRQIALNISNVYMFLAL